MKKFFRFKLIALLLVAVMLVPMTFACGKKSGDTGSTTAAGAATTAAATTAAPAATAAPTTAAPTTTAAPPTFPPIDPSLPYLDQVKTELANHGLKDGVQILAGADEAAVMAAFSVGNGTKEALDVSADKVPFADAYRITVSKDQVNFWEASFKASLAPDVPVKNGDIIVGVMWIRGTRTADSDPAAASPFAKTDPPQYYLALKTPTDNWNSEGEMTPAGVMQATDKWQKVWFSGRILNDETQSSTVGFNIFLGYGIQQMDIGGVIAYYFPSTDATEKGAAELAF